MEKSGIIADNHIKIMNTFYYKIKSALSFLGINPVTAINNFRGLPYYLKDLRKLKKQMAGNSDFPFGTPCLMLRDRFSKAGIMSGHYFHQDLYVARKIYERNPKKHVDIGSSINGFVAHIAVYRDIEIFDVRPHISNVNNIFFKQADMMQLPNGMENYCDSLSALHSIEHFGLGRYGDPVDYYGHIKAIDNIYKIIQPGGAFYFSVPIGKQRIEFNGHRIFSVQYLIDLLADKFFTESFSYIDDKGDFYENSELSTDNIYTNFNCNFGLGIFVLTKK